MIDILSHFVNELGVLSHGYRITVLKLAYDLLTVLSCMF